MRTTIYTTMIALVGAVCHAAEPPMTGKALGELLGYPPEGIHAKETLSLSSDHKPRAVTEAYVEMIKSEKVNDAVAKCAIAAAESLVMK